MGLVAARLGAAGAVAVAVLACNDLLGIQRLSADAGSAPASDSGGSSSGGGSSGGGGKACPFAVADGGLPPIVTGGADGGENTACDGCLRASCRGEFDCCVSDPEQVPVQTGGGTQQVPACYAFVFCVENGYASSPDGGFSGAVSDCEGDGGAFPPASTRAGQAYVGCIVASCAVPCSQ